MRAAAAAVLIAAMVWGSAREVSAAPPVPLAVPAAMVIGGYAGKLVGAKIGIAALGTAITGAWPAAALGAVVSGMAALAVTANGSAAAGIGVSLSTVLATGGAAVVAAATAVHLDDIVPAAKKVWGWTVSAGVAGWRWVRGHRKQADRQEDTRASEKPCVELEPAAPGWPPGFNCGQEGTVG